MCPHGPQVVRRTAPSSASTLRTCRSESSSLCPVRRRRHVRQRLAVQLPHRRDRRAGGVSQAAVPRLEGCRWTDNRRSTRSSGCRHRPASVVRRTGHPRPPMRIDPFSHEGCCEVLGPSPTVEGGCGTVRRGSVSSAAPSSAHARGTGHATDGPGPARRSPPRAPSTHVPDLCAARSGEGTSGAHWWTAALPWPNTSRSSGLSRCSSHAATSMSLCRSPASAGCPSGRRAVRLDQAQLFDHVHGQRPCAARHRSATSRCRNGRRCAWCLTASTQRCTTPCSAARGGDPLAPP